MFSIRKKLVQIFNEEFATPRELTLSDLSNTTFEMLDDVSKCYQKSELQKELYYLMQNSC